MPEDGGADCQLEASEETEDCKRPCHEPVFCEWGAWVDTSSCSVRCGKGTKRKRRHLLAKMGHRRLDAGNFDVDAKDSCEGEQVETVDCAMDACKDLCTPESCKLAPWVDWSPCDCTGLSTRHRSIKQANNEC